MKRKLLFLVLVLILMLNIAALAATSPNYTLGWLLPMTSGGGGAAESDHYAISYSIGQTAIDHSSSTNFSLDAGFWQDFWQKFLIWLPLVRR